MRVQEPATRTWLTAALAPPSQPAEAHPGAAYGRFATLSTEAALQPLGGAAFPPEELVPQPDYHLTGWTATSASGPAASPAVGQRSPTRITAKATNTAPAVTRGPFVAAPQPAEDAGGLPSFAAFRRAQARSLVQC